MLHQSLQSSQTLGQFFEQLYDRAQQADIVEGHLAVGQTGQGESVVVRTLDVRTNRYV